MRYGRFDIEQWASERIDEWKILQKSSTGVTCTKFNLAVMRGSDRKRRTETGWGGGGGERRDERMKDSILRRPLRKRCLITRASSFNDIENIPLNTLTPSWLQLREIECNEVSNAYRLRL